MPNYFRTSYSPGWALVGDAGYNKDLITAQGITGAFAKRGNGEDHPVTPLQETLEEIGAEPVGDTTAQRAAQIKDDTTNTASS